MPDPTEATLLLVLVVAVLGFGVVAISATYGAAEERVDVEDELVQDVGAWTAVDAVDEPGTVGFGANVTVTNASGAELDEGADYEWSAANGSLLILDTAATSDGQTATIDYDLDRRPPQSTAMLAPLRTLFDATGVLPLVVAGGAIFAAVSWMWSTGRSGSYGGRR